MRLVPFSKDRNWAQRGYVTRPGHTPLCVVGLDPNQRPSPSRQLCGPTTEPHCLSRPDAAFPPLTAPSLLLSPARAQAPLEQVPRLILLLGVPPPAPATGSRHSGPL